MSAQVGRLNGQIGSLQGEISVGEKEVAPMRQKYLEAVKKMRLRKAIVLLLPSSSSSGKLQPGHEKDALSQAVPSEWRDNQSALIAAEGGQTENTRLNFLRRPKTTRIEHSGVI